MKIRTITTGITFNSGIDVEKIEQIAEFNQQAKKQFEQNEYEVQTTRIATNSWEEYLSKLHHTEIFGEITKIENNCKRYDVDNFNIGYSQSPELIKLIPQIITNSPIIFCSTKIGDSEKGMDDRAIRASAEVIKQLSKTTSGGLGNFQYCAWANCPPGIPFFPAAYHKGETSFGIGLECSDLVVKTFSRSKDLNEASELLDEILEKEFSEVAAVAENVAKIFGIPFRGIDTSIAPSLEPKESIAYAYEKFGIDKFGHAGTLTLSSLITKVIKQLSVKTTGFCGLMLPVSEDVGLAERVSEGTLNLSNLLLYSSVCGTGLDTIPIPGDTSVDKIEAILRDVATLAIQLNKPLSARLLPVLGKKAGEMTSFNSLYMVESKIMDV